MKEQRRESKLGKNYKWIALSNTTMGGLLASMDGSILIISLPAILNGLGVNTLESGNIALLLWLIMGYTIMSAVMVVTVGRLSDMFGRVKLYNAGFAVFSFASVLIYASSYLIHGDAGVLSIALLRLLQGLGGAFLFANGAAILTDAFPANERGKALGMNQIAIIGGSIAGFLIGGILAAIDWHLVFLISVPIGIIGTVWAYIALHELATIRKHQRLDILGNLVFAVALTAILLSLTYGLLPYGTSTTGWSNPLVQIGCVAGVLLLAAFVFIELRARDPMFNMMLFKIRAFAAGNLSLLLSGVGRGGLQFVLIIWLQGVWLPLHGVSFENTPLQAAIAMLPLVVGFLVSGPLSGYISDKYLSPRLLTTFGMSLNTIGLLLLALVPVNFSYAEFAAIIFVIGIGQGIFAAPNTSSVMSSVPPEYRGVTSGIRATLINVSFMFSFAVFFSLLILGVSGDLQSALYNGLVAQNVSAATASQVSQLPPSSALFAALLGYNPMKVLLPQSVLMSLPRQNVDALLGSNFFPNLISGPFLIGLHLVLYVAAIMSAIAALTSSLRGTSFRIRKA